MSHRVEPLKLSLTLFSAIGLLSFVNPAYSGTSLGCSSNNQCSNGAVCEMSQGHTELDEMVGGSCVINSPDGFKVSFTMEVDTTTWTSRQSDRSGRPIRDISFTGPITHQSVVHFQQILDHYPSRLPKMDTRAPFNLWIDSPGGNVYASMELGRLLRENQVMISILGDAQCASACILTWAGAPMRAIAPGARLIIHRPYNFTAAGGNLRASSSEWQAMQADIRQYLTQMNIPATLLDAMNQVPPESSHNLTDNELSSYLMAENDPAWQELADANQASKLGISRIQYVEMKARYNRCLENLRASYGSCARAFETHARTP
jgi:ATP-dependent protease ClpP protease subunit